MSSHTYRSLALAVLLALAAWPARSQQTAQEPQEPRIRVDVSLVTIIASVLDARGRPLTGLPREAFAIEEAGVPQKIEIFEAETGLPLDLVLMVDTSLSVVKELPFIREAATQFVRQVVREGDRLAVFQFADTITQLSEFTSDTRVLQSAVRRMEAGAGTSLYDAIYLGGRALEERPGGRRRVIVLLTDAGETTSRANFETARRAALRSEAMLYTVLIRPVKSEVGRNTAGEHALITITDTTGGAMYAVENAAELAVTFERIELELRTQYRLGYYPQPRPPARSFRSVSLRVQPPGAEGAEGITVRYRRGYFTIGALE
jgi:Ca-activated chloride channel family protein